MTAKASKSAKEYLEQAYQLDRRICNMIEQAQSLRAMAGKVTDSLSSTPRRETRNARRMEDVIVKRLETESEISCTIESLVELKREIYEAVQRMPGVMKRMLLELRYLRKNPMKWSEIAEKMGEPEASVRGRLHTKALRAYTIYCGLI